LNPTLLRNLSDFIDIFDRFLKCLSSVFARRAVWGPQHAPGNHRAAPPEIFFLTV
jgi:hypothetical protein